MCKTTVLSTQAVKKDFLNSCRSMEETLLFLVGQRFLLNFLAALARGSHRKIFLASACEVLIRIHFNKHSGVMNGFLFHPHIHIFFSPLFLCVWVKTVLSVPNGWTCSFFSYTYSNYNRKERSKWQEKKKKKKRLSWIILHTDFCYLWDLIVN